MRATAKKVKCIIYINFRVYDFALIAAILFTFALHYYNDVV